MKNVIHHFKTHKDATEVHETSNGFLFHEKHDAVAHTVEMSKDADKRIATHKREDFEKEIAASIKADEAAAAKEAKSAEKPSKEEKPKAGNQKEEKPKEEKPEVEKK